MASECGPGKSSWPELVGYNGETAARIIERQNRNVNASVLLEGTPTNLDFRCDRVWVFVNKAGKVVETPTIG
ncbi:hypothetical protein MKW92_043241 [Papaver armeniacum]|nr:hypothetical protein MKW92_043241 [Papaver armeniacum]